MVFTKGMIVTKTEQYLEVLLDIADMLPDYEKQHFINAVSKKLNKEDVYEMGIGGRIGYLTNEMRTEIYDYEVKHSGKGKILSFAKKVLKRAQRLPNKTFHYARKVEDYTYFCDGAMLIRTHQELKSLEAPEEFQGIIGDFDFKGHIVKLSFDTGKKLTLPDLCKLKTLYKLEKVKFKSEEHSRGDGFKFFYNFGDALPAVDGEKLIELMDAIPDIELYSNKYGILCNLYGKSANGSEEVLLCPVRKAYSDGRPSNFRMHTIDDVENVLAE